MFVARTWPPKLCLWISRDWLQVINKRVSGCCTRIYFQSNWRVPLKGCFPALRFSTCVLRFLHTFYVFYMRFTFSTYVLRFLHTFYVFYIRFLHTFPTYVLRSLHTFYVFYIRFYIRFTYGSFACVNARVKHALTRAFMHAKLPYVKRM